ncbi:MAG: S8 family serine peptidase [Bacteroidota bacterium]
MKNHYLLGKGISMSFLFILLTTASLFAQIEQGVVRVKLSESKAAMLQNTKVSKSGGGYLRTGDVSLDAAFAECKADGLKRVFRHGGKFEAKHRKHGLHLWYEISFDKGVSVSSAVAAFAKLSDVQVSEPIHEKAIIGYHPMKMKEIFSLSTEADDPQYSNQWHYNNTGQTGGTIDADVDLPEAWNLETGNSDIIVAVTDGGIDVDHEDLAANMWVNTAEIPGNGIDDDGNGYVDDINGYGFGDNSGTIPADPHGTHVGGTVAAVTNNGIGVAGVAGGSGSGDGVRLMSCAAFGANGVGGFAETYIYGADMGAVISQNSWGYTNPGVFEQAVLDAIDYFIAEAGFDESGNPDGPMQGGIVIFAAGNDGLDAEWYPGIYEPVLAVGGTDHNDGEYTSSNRGDWVEMAAPAVDVVSTTPGNTYSSFTGTSMACPHVSGVAGLIISQNLGNITPTQVWARLVQTTDPLPGLEFFGSGRLNAFAALQQDDGVAPEAIIDLAVAAKDLASVTLTWTAPTDQGNGSATSYDLRFSTSAITADNFDAATPVETIPGAAVAGTAEIYTVSGLASSTTYYFALKSSDFFGNTSEISNSAVETTDDPPSASLEPSSLTSDLTTGESETQSILITNSGSGPLEFDLSLGGTTFTPATSSTSTPKVIKSSTKTLTSKKAFVGEVSRFSGDQYATGFEDGFTLGDLDDQAGWSANFEDWSVSNADPFSGSNHMLGISETLPGDANASLAFSPNVGVGTEKYSSVNAKLKVDNDGVTWQFIPQSPTAELVVTRLSFDPDGGVSILDSEVDDFVVISTELPADYFDLKIVVDRASFDMNVYFDNELVYVGKAVTGDIEQVVLLSLMEEEGNEFSMDDVIIYDGVLDTYPFLSSGVESGVIAGGNEQEIDITFDATGLFGGTYANEIQISTNDPANPEFTVPAVLMVTGTGKPIIATDPEALAFGDSFIGGTTTQELTITNNGTEILNVTDLSTTGDFSVDNSSFSLLPFESEVIVVAFSPTVLGVLEGDLIITNNDTVNPQLTVDLSGSGVEAPIIAVNPSELSAELDRGTSTTEILTITNNGVAALDFTVEIGEVAEEVSSVTIDIAAAKSSLSVSNNLVKQSVSNSFRGMSLTSDVQLSAGELNVLVLTPDDDVSDLATTLDAFPDLNISTYPKADLPAIALADLTAYDLVVTSNNTQWLASGNVDPALIGNLLADYIDQGGKVIANSFAYDYSDWALGGRFISEGYGPFTGTTDDFSGNNSLGTIVAPDHPVMANVTSITTSYLWQDPSLADGAILLADWADGNHFAAANENVVALNILPSDGDGVPGWTGDLATLYHNAALWLTGSGFVSIDTEEGTLAQGESAEITVTISAEGLEAGVYEALVNVISNDPVNGTVGVPVELTVIGPAISANPEQLEATVLQGLAETQTLTISNNGSADAEFVIDIVNNSGAAEVSLAIDDSPRRTEAYSGPALGFAAAVDKGISQLAAGDEVYATGFENFSIGNINGQQGWSGEFGNWRVESNEPKSGTQHFEAVSDGFGRSIAISPLLTLGEAEVTTASMDIYLEEGASWWISTEGATAINARVIFDTEGRVVMISTNSAGDVLLDTIQYNLPNEYFNIAFEVDRSTLDFKFYINSTEVFAGTAFSGDLTNVVVLSQMETAGPLFRMDNLDVYEGIYVPDFLTLSNMSGLIPAGGSIDVEVTFDASQVAFGTYLRDIQVFVDGSASTDLVVPTTFNVTGAASVEVTPQVLEQEVNYQELETTEFAIHNTGGQPINFGVNVFGADLEDQSRELAESTRPEKSGEKYDQYMSHVALQKISPSTTQLMVGETLMSESFDGATFPPANWTIVDNEGEGVQWDMLAAHNLENWSGAGEAASVHSDAAGELEYDTELITPAIDIDGRTGVAVQYNANYINFLNEDYLDLDVTTDGGTTWTTVLSWNESHGTFYGAPGEFVSVALDDYVSGASTMQLRWRYYNPNTGDWDFYVQIDDVEVLADANTWLTVSPAIGSIPVGESQTVTATFDAAKVDPGQYFAGILINSNASNTPVASVFSIMNVLEPAAIVVNPTELEQVLVTGFSETQTLSITNDGESVLRYELGGFLKDAAVVSVKKEQGERIETVKRTSRSEVEFTSGIEAIDVITVKKFTTDPVYGTDFESFDLGNINGQNGWFGQFGNWTVESENSDSGNQHFRGLADGFGLSASASPNVGIGTEAISSFTADVHLTGTGVTWQIIPQSATDETVVTRIQMTAEGGLELLVDDGTGTPVFESLGDVPSDYFNLKVQSDRATSVIDVFIDKELVYSGQGFAGDIEEVIVLSLMEEAGPTLDIDDMNIWDGEAPIPFLSTNPEFGNVAAGETVDIEVTFDATYLEKGIYSDNILVFNNDPESSVVTVPVTLEVINPPAVQVDPETIESTVFVGSTQDHNMTITNTGEANLRFGFAGFGDAPEPGVFAKQSRELSNRELQKLARDEEGSKIQINTTPIRFMEGEELLSEDFEGENFPPDGWSVVDNEGNGLIWEASSDNYTGGLGNSAMANSGANEDVEYDTELRSPVIDVDGKGGVVVQYYANYQNYLNGDFLDLDITTDGGASWTNVLSWNEDHGSFESVPGEYVTVELDDYISGAASMQLRWRYYNPNTGDWDWYVQLDDIQIIYEGIQWLTIDPGQGVLGEGESMNLNVTFNATEVEPGTYTEELLLLTNVPNEPQKTLEMTMIAAIVEPLELAATCSDNPDAKRRWEVNNPNAFDVDAFWFIIGSAVNDSITLSPGINYFSSPTQTDRSNNLKIRWLDHTASSNEAVAESSDLPCLVENLNLTSMCSNNPDIFRRWRVRNPNPFQVMINWNVVGTTQSGIIYAAGNEDTFFFTEAIEGANTTIIKWLDQDGEERQNVKASSGEVCDVDNSCAGGDVIAFEQGAKRNGKAISSRRSDAANAIGAPQQADGYNFVSLGFGGSITIKLSNTVVDQPGNDFILIETSFRDTNKACSSYPETADVFVSQDGEQFILVGEACKDTEFDIATAGVMDISYIKIVDTSDPADFKGNADGFDVDGIACMNMYSSQSAPFAQRQSENNVPDEEGEAGVVTFPNPFRDQIAVTMEVEADGCYDLIVHDLYGAEVYRGETTSSFGQIKAEINAKGFADGTYMLTIVAKDESTRTTHLMIKR